MVVSISNSIPLDSLSNSIPLDSCLTLKVPETKIAEFANSVDHNEMAHNEPSHQDLHCLPSSL